MKDSHKQNQTLFICQQTVEYFTFLLMSGSFLAALCSSCGLSDSITGVLSSFGALGYLFELISLILKPRSIKRAYLVSSTLSQLLFVLMYFTPLLPLSSVGKQFLLIGAFFVSYVFYYCCRPGMLSWYMESVPDAQRGIFTANKEMISLVGGMAFSYLCGAVCDRFRNGPKETLASLFCGLTVLALCLVHFLIVLRSHEEVCSSPEEATHLSLRDSLAVLRDPAVWKVSGVLIGWEIALCVAYPFFGTYQIKEMGFSLTFVSVLNIIASAVRFSLSRFMGRYADRHSFAGMLKICLLAMAVGFLIAALASPQNGKVCFIGFFVCFGIAYAGVNSACMNLVFDYVPAEKRADSLAVSQSFSGILGFLVTVLVSPAVEAIQRSGNQLFGFPVYAQQLGSVVTVVLLLGLYLYTDKVIVPLPKVTKE